MNDNDKFQIAKLLMAEYIKGPAPAAETAAALINNYDYSPEEAAKYSEAAFEWWVEAYSGKW